MPAQQLELDLWAELQDAVEMPHFANLNELWLLLEQVIQPLPQAQQLTIAAQAIEQMAEVLALRASVLLATWEAAHSDQEQVAPVLDGSLIETWVKQSMSVNIDAFVEQPRSTRQRRTEVKLAPTDSVVAEVDPAAVLQMLDQIGQEQNAEQMVRDLAGEENVEQWVAAIMRKLQTQVEDNESIAKRPFASISLVELQRQLQMPWVEVWLGALLGNFRLEQRGEFYEGEILVSHSALNHGRETLTKLSTSVLPIA